MISHRYRLIFSLALLSLGFGIADGSSEPPSNKRMRPIDEAELKEMQAAHAQQTAQLRRAFAAKEWLNWVNSLEDNVTIDEIAAAYSYNHNPFKELLETGRLYFNEVSAEKRFYHEANDKLQPSKLYQSLANIRHLQVKSPFSVLAETSSDSDEQNQEWLSLRSASRKAEHDKKREMISHLQAEVIPSAHTFRPYAIALALGSCLWPDNELAYSDAIPTTRALTELWATGQIGAYEQTMETARCLNAAFDIYIEAQEHVPLEIPHLDPHHIAQLMPCVQDYSISSKEAAEVVKKRLESLFELEDVVFDILEKFKKVLKDNKAYDIAKMIHRLANTEIGSRQEMLSNLKEQLRAMQKQNKNAAFIEGTTSIMNTLAKRQAEYYKRLGNLLCCGTPAPSPFQDFAIDEAETDSAKSSDSSSIISSETSPALLDL